MSFRAYVYLGPIYTFSIGLLYVWGYWSPFGINPLEYMGIEQVVATAIIPVVAAAVIVGFGAIVGEFVVPADPAGGSQGTKAIQRGKVGEYLYRHLRDIAFLWFAAIFVVAEWSPSPYKWFSVASMVGVAGYVPLKRSGLFSDFLKHESARSVAVFLTAVLPVWSYATGLENANKVKDGKSFEYVISSNIQSLNAQLDSAKPCKLRVVGRMGSTLFTMSFPDARLTVVELSGGASLTTGSSTQCN